MDDHPKALLTQTSTHTVADVPPPYIPTLTPAVLPVVYSRDFAYANNGPIVVLPVRMAATDITNADAKTFAELLSGPSVDIYVGPEKKKWSLHRNLLVHHSSYCERELQSQSHDSEKSNKLQLDLPQDNPIGFELLVKWLYQGTLQPTTFFTTDSAKYDHAVSCHKLYLICHRFEMTRLKNIAIDTYRRCLHESQLVPDAEEINDIYHCSESPVNNPFRKLMVKIAARQIMDPEVDRCAEAYRKCFANHPDFAVEVIGEIRNMSKGMLFEDPTNGNMCSYHDHDHEDVTACPMQGAGKTRVPKKAKVNEGPPTHHDSRRANPSPLTHMEPASAAEKRTPRKLRARSPKLTGPGVEITPQLASVPISNEHKILVESHLPTTENTTDLRGVENQTPSNDPLLNLPIRNTTSWPRNLRGELTTSRNSSVVNDKEDSIVGAEISSSSSSSPPRERSLVEREVGVIAASGRKLRVGSIVRKLNDEMKKTSVREEGEKEKEKEKVGKRQPPKLTMRRKGGVLDGVVTG